MSAKGGYRQALAPLGGPDRRRTETGAGGAAPPSANAKRRPRKISPKSLESAALHYLERFASSAENLRRVLMRRVHKSARVHDFDPEEAAGWVDGIVERYARSGLLDDRRYAENMAHSLSRRGAATRAIRARLRQKGVAADDIDHAIAALCEETGDADLAAALALIRRRRLGPHRDPDTRAEFRDKDLAALARAGFSYDLARRVIEAEDVAALGADGYG